MTMKLNLILELNYYRFFLPYIVSVAAYKTLTFLSAALNQIFMRGYLPLHVCQNKTKNARVRVFNIVSPLTRIDRLRTIDSV